MFISLSSMRVHVHYFRFDQQYEGWDVWVWPMHREGMAVQWTGNDAFGRTAVCALHGLEGITKIGFVLRRNTVTEQWVEREYGDRFIETVDAHGDAHVWIVQGDPHMYTDAQLAMARARARIAHASLVLPQRIIAHVTPPFDVHAVHAVAVRDAARDVPVHAVFAENATTLRIELGENIDITRTHTLHIDGYASGPISVQGMFDHPTFLSTMTYDGDDLGAVYTPTSTSFRVWAPTAMRVAVLLYALDGTHTRIPMLRSIGGTHHIVIAGDLDGQQYRYTVWHEEDASIDVVDPYTRALVANGEWGVVIAPERSHPHGWDADRAPRLDAPTDAIIYELHVRDATMHPYSGCVHRGTYVGLTEQQTTTPSGTPTALSYIAQLGVTHIQLLPVHDFVSVDETNAAAHYNWGYDPAFYFAPEGSYSTDASCPYARILELKTLIMTLHAHGLRVVIDVVYNHLFSCLRSALHGLVPGYYFRTWENGTFSDGTGCGNDTASERKMMRKLIIDSVTYWAQTYHIDGFRFDLMGNHDIETMNEVRARIDAIDPSILIYGEGWNLPTALATHKKAIIAHTEAMPRIGQFNDQLRDALRGNVFSTHDRGFVNGQGRRAEDVLIGLVGSVRYSPHHCGWATEPWQTINYAEVHDNHTLWDRLCLTNSDEPEAYRKRMHRLATAIVLTAQGIPLIHAGQEFFRTKYGDHNSYRSGDAINALDYVRAAREEDTVAYVRGLIALRKQFSALRLPTAQHIRSYIRRVPSAPGTLQIAIDDGKHVLMLVYNALRDPLFVPLPDDAPWSVHVHNDVSSVQPLEGVSDPHTLAPLCMGMWVRPSTCSTYSR
ncbi:MAG: type I pullulanase [Paenibacillaceae bacterium]|nr:type I pullulanase [Paenibacillaceae bacterium]